MQEAYIKSRLRSAIGKAKKEAFASTRCPDDLGAEVITLSGLCPPPGISR